MGLFHVRVNKILNGLCFIKKMCLFLDIFQNLAVRGASGVYEAEDYEEQNEDPSNDPKVISVSYIHLGF